MYYGQYAYEGEKRVILEQRKCEVQLDFEMYISSNTELSRLIRGLLEYTSCLACS